MRELKEDCGCITVTLDGYPLSGSKVQHSSLCAAAPQMLKALIRAEMAISPNWPMALKEVQEAIELATKEKV